MPISMVRGVLPSSESSPNWSGELVMERVGSSSWLWFRMLFTLSEASALIRSVNRIFFFIPIFKFQYERPRNVPYPPLLLSKPRTRGRRVLYTDVGSPKMVYAPATLWTDADVFLTVCTQFASVLRSFASAEPKSCPPL